MGLRTLSSVIVQASLCGLIGCASKKLPEPKPVMSLGEGAISGKLVTAAGDAFDLAAAKDAGKGSLEIQLISPDHAVVATTSPWVGKPQFLFNHVKPGAYELSIYRSILGKRTIAGSEPVTVDAGQVTPVTVTLQVTEAGDEKPAN